MVLELTHTELLINIVYNDEYLTLNIFQPTFPKTLFIADTIFDQPQHNWVSIALIGCT